MNILYRIMLLPILCLALCTFCTNSSALDLGDYLETSNSSGLDKRISLDFKNATLEDVLKIFSQQSGMNFIASETIAGKTVNLYLENVPVEEALERILFANNLTYNLNSGGNIFVVRNLDQPDIQTITRIYKLRHASVPGSKMSSMLTFDGEGDSGGGSEEGDAGASGGIVAAIESILTENGSVVEDIRTNSLIVTDLPTQFPSIEQTIARLDVRIPQILIEVEMLDIAKSTADLLGVKFGDTPLTVQGNAKSASFPFNFNDLRRDVGDSANGWIIGDPTTATVPSYSLGNTNFEGLSFIMQFLRTKADTRNLARPRILTLNNETAEIEIVTDETVGVISTTDASEGIATTDVEPERVETGVFLKVTPQANIQTREITMAIEPRVTQARTGATFGSTTFKDPEVRGTKSILRIKDSDTIIIGGLLRTDFTEAKTKVPLFGKLPIVGSAFRHKDLTESERELIIFITPHILKENMSSNTALVNRNITTLRERSMPSQKLNMIDKELTTFEQTTQY